MVLVGTGPELIDIGIEQVCIFPVKAVCIYICHGQNIGRIGCEGRRLSVSVAYLETDIFPSWNYPARRVLRVMLWIGGIIAAEYLCSWQPHFLGSRKRCRLDPPVDLRYPLCIPCSKRFVHLRAPGIFCPHTPESFCKFIPWKRLKCRQWIRQINSALFRPERHQVILRFRRNIFFRVCSQTI